MVLRNVYVEHINYKLASTQYSNTLQWGIIQSEKCLLNNNIKYHLEPPHLHRQNAAERVIQ